MHREHHEKAQKAPKLIIKTGIKAGPIFESGDVRIEVDEDGFLVDPANWSCKVDLALDPE